MWDENKVEVAETAMFATKLFFELYSQVAKLANVTSDSPRVYKMLFSLTDFNQQRLIRFRMLSILIPNLRQIIATTATISQQSNFSGMQSFWND